MQAQDVSEKKEEGEKTYRHRWKVQVMQCVLVSIKVGLRRNCNRLLRQVFLGSLSLKRCDQLFDHGNKFNLEI